MTAHADLEKRWRILDAHVHVGLDKYRPIDEFETDAAHCGVDRAILVQHLGQYDNSYLAACVRRAPDRYAGIAMVDVDSPHACEDIEAVAADGAFAGVRLEARTRSAGFEPLQIWRAIADNGMVASVRGPLEDILDPGFLAMLEELPGLPVRLEHGAFFRYGHSSDAELEGVLALAARPHTYLMWSGYYDFSAWSYPHPDAFAFLRATLAAYGASRIMWSGDWNRNDLDPHRPDEYYRQAVSYLDKELDFVGDDELPDLMEGSALSFLRESRTLSTGGMA